MRLSGKYALILAKKPAVSLYYLTLWYKWNHFQNQIIINYQVIKNDYEENTDIDLSCCFVSGYFGADQSAGRLRNRSVLFHHTYTPGADIKTDGFAMRH